ncbi:MAG: iron-containing alcohol dehydrogenase [Clostridiales bacterium]|nr:iron-containing alcohol dehydrogenase [Clostridiales bacterium]
MAGYVAPREILFGRESVEQLSRLRGKRAMLITAGDKMEQRGFLSRALNALKRTGMETESHKAENREDPEACAQTGAAMLRAFMPDWIIALGSESVAAAKLMWVFYEYPEATLLDLQIPGSLPLLRRKARFAAVPGLDATVEAVSAFAGVAGSKNRAAWSLHGGEIVPDMAFLDPEMLAAEQAVSIAETAAAVFSRAVDAFTGKEHTPFIAPYAAEAARLVLSCGRNAMNGAPEALYALQHAQTLAGIAFSNALHAPSAAFARQTAGFFACAEKRQGTLALLFLPHLIRFFAEDGEAAKRYAALAGMLNIKGKTPLQAAENLAKTAERLRDDIELPGTLRKLGIDGLFFDQYLSVLSSRAAADSYATGGLRILAEGTAKELLRSAFGSEGS